MPNINPSDFRFLKFFPFAEIDNWSAYTLLGNNIGFNSDFPFVKIKQFLTRNKTQVEIQDNVLYKRPKIKLYNQGILLRDEVLGKEIGTKNQFRISSGQFLLSKIDARNGAFGVVDESLDFGVITGNFWTFDVDYSKIDPYYLNLVTSSKEFHNFCQSASVGTTGRNYLQEESFLNISIPLPSKDEQKKLVDDFNLKIANSEKLIAQSVQSVNSIESFILNELAVKVQKQLFKKGLQLIENKDLTVWSVEKLFAESIFKSSKYPTFKLVENQVLYNDAFRGKSPKYDDRSTEVILNQKCNRWNEINLAYTKTVNEYWLKNIDKKFLTSENDIIINSTGEGTIGRSSLITKDFEGYLYDSHILLLRLNQNLFNPLFFVYQFNSTFVQEQINQIKSAQSTKQTELGIDNLLNINFVVPPIEIQNEICLKINIITEQIEQQNSVSDTLKEKAKLEFEQLLFKR
ncbi:MAG: restriction endonuclease subunit S [Flavobacterium sp.]